MKWLMLPLAALSMALGVACLRKSENKETVSVKKEEIVTCFGNTPCNACSSCNYCKWCSSGGSCGICKAPKKSKAKVYTSPAVSAQCKAITKKGTRCSRKARSGGYCWQHGG